MVWVGFQHLPTQNDATGTWELTRSWNPWDFYTKKLPTMDWFEDLRVPPYQDILNGESQGLIISFPILLAISRWIRHSPMSNGLLCFTPIIYHIFASNSQNLHASGFSTSSEVFMAKPKKTPSPKARRGERGMQPLWNEGSSIILLGLGLSFRSLVWVFPIIAI